MVAIRRYLSSAHGLEPRGSFSSLFARLSAFNAEELLEHLEFRLQSFSSAELNANLVHSSARLAKEVNLQKLTFKNQRLRSHGRSIHMNRRGESRLDSRLFPIRIVSTSHREAIRAMPSHASGAALDRGSQPEKLRIGSGVITGLANEFRHLAHHTFNN